MMIRDLRPDDIAACIEIVCSNWGDEVAAKATLEMNHAFLSGMVWPPIYFVAEENGKICGFAGMMQSWIMHGVWDFIWINISREHQMKGLGRALTEHRIAEVKRRGGSLIHLMTKRVGFFEKMGFRRIVTYGDDNCWSMMTYQLNMIDLPTTSTAPRTGTTTSTVI